jgi:hypothetical protein
MTARVFLLIYWRLLYFFLAILKRESTVWWDDPSSHILVELDDGKIYRRPLYLMVKTMVSCRFSLKPIHFSTHAMGFMGFCQGGGRGNIGSNSRRRNGA